MLVLSRKLGQTITIGDEIRITIVGMEGQYVKLGVQAPKSIPIHRGEIYERIKLENQRAALANHEDLQRLASAWKKNKIKEETSSCKKKNKDQS
jgi:carbon storage regulator